MSSSITTSGGSRGWVRGCNPARGCSRRGVDERTVNPRLLHGQYTESRLEAWSSPNGP